MTKRIGLMVGREWSFPPAFIEEVQRRDAGVIAEFVKLGGAAHGRAVPVRRHHRPDLARGAVLPHLPQARGAAGRRRSSTTRSCGRPTTSSSARRWPRSSASRSPKTVVLPNKEYVPGIVPRREPAQPRVPARLGGHRRVRRPALHPQGRARRRLEGGLRLPLARGADPPLRRLRPADDDRAGVHRVGAVRPLPLPRPGGDPADASTIPRERQLHRGARATCRRRWAARSSRTR